MPAYVLDASALVALFQEEPGAARVRQLLESAQRGNDSLSIAVVNLGETLYITTARRGAEARRSALRRIGGWPIAIVNVDLDLTLEASVLKTGQDLGYVDAFAAVLARRLRATLVTSDPDFRRVEPMVNVEFLPQATP